MNGKEIILSIILVLFISFNIWTYFNGKESINKYLTELSNIRTELTKSTEGLAKGIINLENNNKGIERTTEDIRGTANSFGDNNRRLEDFIKQN